MDLRLLEDARYYESSDKKVGIILFHAYTGTPNDVNLLARKLNRLGYGVLCPLFKGHGTKDVRDILAVNISEWKDQAKNILALMEQEYETILTFGLSKGGIFATWLMTLPETRITGGGVFNSPVLTAKEINVEKPFTEYTNYLFKRFKPEEDFETAFPDILSEHREQMRALGEFRAAFAEQLINITQPFYIAQSGEDEMVEADDADLLLKALKHTEVNYNWFPENTHVITTNRHRKGFEASVIHFIDRVVS